ncbi:MAG: hypothetical protein J6S67_10810 [Methanobrevibacter sp.]|nr:hypothetical protein [Methanobrevibacter sp.]
MSTIPTNTDVAPFVIKKFLGLNLTTTGDTQILDGESGNMNNFVITDDYKLRKCDGYKMVYDFESQVTGTYVYNTGEEVYLLIVADGKLYKISQSILDDDSQWDELTPTLIGSVGDYDTTFFSFDGKVYILNGHKYYSYDGTTLSEVEGYTPLVYVNTPPAGGGTEYDQINLLSSKKHMTFNADGVADTYQLAEKGIDSVDKVIVNGTEVASTGYSVNTTNGTVTFTTIPTSGMDNVDIYWGKNNNTRSFIEGMTAGIVYGGDVDTKVFLYGNSSEPNRIRYSGTANGAPSVEYFPATYQVDVGPSNFAVTDCTRQYDRLLVTTNKPEAYTIGIDLINVNGYETPSVVTLPLNEVHGNIAFAQGQVINNDPVTIENGQLIRWKSTSIRDERNMEVISDKIRDDLITLNLKAVKTCDFQDKNQLWLALGNRIYIYNYFNKTYSRLSLPIDTGLFQVVGRNMYMTNVDGALYKFDANYQKFDDEIINAHWEMNFSSFGMSYLRKTMRKLWVLMQPQTSSSAEIGYITNRNESAVKKTISYKLTLLDDVDFSDFTFKVSSNPQPFRLKLKAKKFTNLKVTIDNENTDDCTILELALKLETNGESK